MASAPAPRTRKAQKRRSIIGMIFSFIGCMLCLCIMAASVGGVLLSMYIVQVTADDAETLDLDNQKTARRRSSTTSTATSTPRSPATRTVSGVSSPPCRTT